MDPLEKLAGLFQRFPGIGPRQSQRFVQYLLRSSPSLRRELIDSIRDLGSAVRQCPLCKRYSSDGSGMCSICADTSRDGTLAIVASDADMLALERSHTYRGKYFILGGLISLTSDSVAGLHLSDLMQSIPNRSGLTEIILAFPANPEGDATATRVKEELAKTGIRVTKLGRGLSTGSELEYADPDTLKSALDNRK